MRLVPFKRTLPAWALLSALFCNADAVFAATDDDFFSWYGLGVGGSLGKISPTLEPFHWNVLNQARLGDDGSDLTENLLFAQLGYAITDSTLVSLGYVHNWLSPLGGKAFDENRSYEEFRWSDNLDIGKLTARTRLEQRFRFETPAATSDGLPGKCWSSPGPSRRSPISVWWDRRKPSST